VSDGIFITPGWWGMLETPATEPDLQNRTD
jgi:hypothetical protein